MSTAFDFSKVKKAARAKSLNDLYAAGIPGLTDPEMQYGDNKGESKIKGTVEKYKNANTKKRILKQYYGNDTETPEEAKDNDRLSKFDMNTDLPATEYITDYFNDFQNRVTQSQPEVNPTKYDREYAEKYFPNIGFVSLPGSLATPDNVKKGILGSTGLIKTPAVLDENGSMLDNLLGLKNYVKTSRYGANTHSHPVEVGPSPEDRANIDDTGFIVTKGGRVVRYNKNPAKDQVNPNLINKVNKLSDLYHK